MKMTYLKLPFAACLTLAFLTACEMHPASQVPGGHGHAEAAEGHGAGEKHEAPAVEATPVPEMFPKQP